jgi:CelD/BcsL family acetyltransferase involved in cellulose biosynthesis
VIEVLTEAEQLTGEVLDAWRAFAEEAALPFSTPEWMLAFWHRVHEPQGARLRVVVVRDGAGAIAGVGPFYETGRAPPGLAEYRLLGAGIGQRTAPLAREDAFEDVARALAGSLASATPRPSSLVLDALPAGSAWPGALRGAWPGVLGARARVDRRTPGLVATMAVDHEAWLKHKSRNYRRQQVRRRREIAARGGRLRRSEGPAQADADLDALFRLHGERFAAQGKRTSLGPEYRAAVGDATVALVARRRAALWVIDAGGEVVGAQLFLLAGDRLCAWNGGISPAWEHASLGLVLFDEAIRDAHELGARVVDFGSGDQAYKAHFTDADEPIEWSSILVRDHRYPLLRATMVPRQGREAARRIARSLLHSWQRRPRG